MTSITPNTEIRRLYESIRIKLADILDLDEGWRKLAQTLTRADVEGEPLYTNDEITRFAINKRSPTLLLLDDWGTRGRTRPTVSVLIANLAKANLYRAAEYLQISILKGPPLKRPDEGLAAEPNLGNVDFTRYLPVSESFECDEKSMKKCGTEDSDLPSIILNEEKDPTKVAIPHLPFNDLFKATFGFNITYKLGEGGFGAVYLGHVLINNKRQSVAVKKLTLTGQINLVEEQFQTELKAMARYNHENLLQILAFSCDNPQAKCLVCAFMPNGSLEQNLRIKNGRKHMLWDVRLNIAIGAAKGLVELHTRYEPLVHRDIKSANILLDENFTAKIGDFGTARLGGDWNATTEAITKRWCGTPVYMADEALKGSVTVKMDTFSYGVVLFEILTGYPAYINAEKGTLVEYIEEEEDRCALDWQDKEAGDWPDHVVEALFACATRCVERMKKKRPLMTEVLKDLNSIPVIPSDQP